MLDPTGRVAMVSGASRGIGALSNAAGISTPRVRLDDDDETALEGMWRVNVKGPLRLIRAALPPLQTRLPHRRKPLPAVAL